MVTTRYYAGWEHRCSSCLFVSNLFLLEWPLFQGMLVLQVAFYTLSLPEGYLLQGKTSSRWLSLPLYFSLSNLATLLGLINILQRKRAARRGSLEGGDDPTVPHLLPSTSRTGPSRA